jgi:hypothetical protein
VRYVEGYLPPIPPISYPDDTTQADANGNIVDQGKWEIQAEASDNFVINQ